MYAIIACQKDIASMNILDQLLEHYNFKEAKDFFYGNPIYQNGNIKLYIIGELHIDSSLPNEIEENELIFISKHKSESGKATLTVHPVGNWGFAEFGGMNKTVCGTNPCLMKKMLIELKKIKEDRKLKQYDVSVEVTHHGPYIEEGRKALFIELGSDEKQWQDLDGAKAIADSVMTTLTSNYENNFVNAVGIGGGHYSHEFTKVNMKSNYALGHMCPKYALSFLNPEILKEALRHSDAKTIIVNTKGLGNKKNEILQMLEENNFDFIKFSKINFE